MKIIVLEFFTTNESEGSLEEIANIKFSDIDSASLDNMWRKGVVSGKVFQLIKKLLKVVN